MTMNAKLRGWAGGFGLADFLEDAVAGVMSALPPEVQRDLIDDPNFMLCDYEPGPGVVMNVPMSLGGHGAGGQLAGRSIVLKRTLRFRSPEFVRWLIAHELAHAHLRNGSHGDEDPESAADSLAARWGFPRPAR